jgi:hypothetical protein
MSNNFKVHPHEDIMRKWLDGETIQFLSENEWVAIRTPSWQPSVKYRVKPKEYEKKYIPVGVSDNSNYLHVNGVYTNTNTTKINSNYSEDTYKVRQTICIEIDPDTQHIEKVYLMK